MKFISAYSPSFDLRMPTSRKATNQPFDESESSRKANPRNSVVRSGCTSRSQIQGEQGGRGDIGLFCSLCTRKIVGYSTKGLYGREGHQFF